MAYSETSEYAYGLLEHFYHLHENQILILGKENLRIMMPDRIFALLQAKDNDGNIDFPVKFKDIDLQVYTGSSIIFALKEVRK